MSLDMMFGMGGAKKSSNSNKPIIIKVDGKEIICGDDANGEKILNLRKLLIKNKIDVYPLKAKITGNCGGAGNATTKALVAHSLLINRL